MRAARKVVSLLAIYQDVEDLVNIGAYVPGQNIEIDLAVLSRAHIVSFLQQDSNAPTDLETSKTQLLGLMKFIEQREAQLKAGAKKPAQRVAGSGS